MDTTAAPEESSSGPPPKPSVLTAWHSSFPTFLLALWLIFAALASALLENLGKGVLFATGGTVAALVIVGIVLAIATVPALVPQLIAACVARRNRLESVGFRLMGYFVCRESYPDGRWRLVRSPGQTTLLTVAASDDDDLAARLVRFWGAMPIASFALTTAAILGAFALYFALDGDRWQDLALVLSSLVVAIFVVVGHRFVRAEPRSPRSIIRSLRAGGTEAEREMAYFVVNSYRLRKIRARDQNPRWMSVLVDLLHEAPTLHEYRLMLLSYLLDHDRTEDLQLQRDEILALQDHFAKGNGGPYASIVVWYAAFLSPDPDEAAGIWAWIQEPEPGMRAAESLLHARIALLRGDPSLARRLGDQARTGYLEMHLPPSDEAFTLEHTDRFLAGLPPENPPRD